MSKKLLLLIVVIIFGCGNSINLYSIDFITKHGVTVSVGDINAPTKNEVEEWTQETIDFWGNYYLNKWQCLYNSAHNTTAIFVDEDYLLLDDNPVSGFELRYFIHISYGSQVKLRGVFIHELSHVFAHYCFEEPTNNGGHLFFDKNDLCSLTKYC